MIIRALSICLFIISVTPIINGQSKINLGVGYLGHTLTHPGAIFYVEYEEMNTPIASLTGRIEIGYFSHPRNHDGLFVDVNIGYRRYFDSGLFLEQGIGIGALKTRINSDNVYKVDDSGKVESSNRWMPIDLMPSLNIGMGYDLQSFTSHPLSVWMRPKVFWQLPHKTSSTFHPVIECGLNYTLGQAEDE